MLALTFQVGDSRFALDVRSVREVAPRAPLERLQGGPAWLAGLLNYRALVLPVIDLHALMQAGACPPYLSSRIIVAQKGPDDGPLVGLLAAGVSELRQWPAAAASTGHFSSDLVGGLMIDHGEILRHFNLANDLPTEAWEWSRQGAAR